ncbi:hypothetical protein GCM10028813_02330 [Ramlibacter alkalitolerans]
MLWAGVAAAEEYAPAPTTASVAAPAQPTLAERLDKDMQVPAMPAKAETHGRSGGNAIVEVDAPAKPLNIVMRAEQATDALPAVTVSPVKISRDSTLEESLRLVLAASGADISLSLHPDLAPKADTGSAGSGAVGLRGSLTDVLDELSQSYGFHYTFDARKSVLRVLPERMYVLEFPPQAEIAEATAKTLPGLGAQDVNYNPSTSLVSFRASRRVAEDVAAYVKQVAAEQQQITYEVSVIEVRLDDDATAGIQWDKLGWASGNSSLSFSTKSTGAALTGGIGMGMKYAVGNLALDGILSFLRTQGAVRIMNQPVAHVQSGLTAKFDNQNSITYVSSVGTTAVGNGNATSTTMQTSAVKVGTAMEVSGRVREGTVYTRIKLTMSELVGMNTVTSGDSTLQLPETSDRTIETPSVRVRPGEAVLLGGIITTRDETQREAPNVPFLKDLFATRRQQKGSRYELVVVLRPSVTTFEPAKVPQ